jgi:hypothetical protein
MLEPQCLTNLWASTACYRVSFTLSLPALQTNIEHQPYCYVQCVCHTLFCHQKAFLYVPAVLTNIITDVEMQFVVKNT